MDVRGDDALLLESGYDRGSHVARNVRGVGAAADRDPHAQVRRALLHGVVVGDSVRGQQHHAAHGGGEDGTQRSVAPLELANVVAAPLDPVDDLKRRSARAGVGRQQHGIAQAIFAVTSPR